MAGAGLSRERLGVMGYVASCFLFPEFRFALLLDLFSLKSSATSQFIGK